MFLVFFQRNIPGELFSVVCRLFDSQMYFLQPWLNKSNINETVGNRHSACFNPPLNTMVDPLAMKLHIQGGKTILFCTNFEQSWAIEYFLSRCLETKYFRFRADHNHGNSLGLTCRPTRVSRIIVGTKTICRLNRGHSSREMCKNMIHH